MFDQLAINYINETFQKVFIQTVLLETKDWQDCGSFTFFDNSEIIGECIRITTKISHVFTKFNHTLYPLFFKILLLFLSLDVFDHKTLGIFTLLEDECKKQKPKSEHFISQFRTERSKYPNPRLSLPPTVENEFVVRHFAKDVQYNMV